MKRLILALLCFAGTTVAMATIDKEEHQKAIQDNIQLPPKPPSPPSPAALEHRRAQLDAKRDADVRAAKRGIHRAARKTKHKLQSILPPRPPKR